MNGTQDDTAVDRITARLWRAVLLALAAVLAAGAWEHRQTRSYTATAFGTVTATAPAGGACAGCAGHRVRIEYAAGDRTRVLLMNPALFDEARFEQVGAALPLRYDPARPERAVVDLPWYRYPVTAMLAMLAAGVTAAVAWVTTLRRRDLAREARFQARMRRTRRMPLAARPNRRRLMAALHRQIALGGLGLLCVLGGVFTRSVMLVSAGMLLALIAGIRIGRLARCPHCGASLRGALAKALPLAQSDRPGEGLQVLRLRDVLASGADLQCSACGRELDDPPPPAR